MKLLLNCSVLVLALCGCNGGMSDSKTPEELNEPKDNKPQNQSPKNKNNPGKLQLLVKPGDTRTDDKHRESYACANMPGYCVSSLEWGKIDVNAPNGGIKNFKDAIVWWNGSKSWDWRTTNVRHDPGVSSEALQELLAIPEITDIILTRGMEGVLMVPEKTIEEALKAGKNVHVAFTRDAVELYNKLIKEGKKVGGLFHSTC